VTSSASSLSASSWPSPGATRWARWGALALGAGVVGIYYFGRLSIDARNRFHTLVYLAVLLAAAAAAGWRGRNRPKERRGWYIISLANFLFAMTLALTHGTEIGLISASRLLYSLDASRLVSNILLGIGMLSWPLSPPSSPERRRMVLDAAIFAAALFFIFWAVAWGEVFRASQEKLLNKLLDLGFPLLYVLLLGIAVYLGIRNPKRFLGPLGWMTLGVSFSFLVSIGWALLSLRGTFYAGHDLDGVTILIPLMRLLAPFSLEPVGEPPTLADVQDHSSFGSLLPYLPILPALALGMWLLVHGRALADAILVWSALVMVMLLLVRQFLALNDLHRLSKSLETRVLERTEALEASQAALLRTEQMNMVATLGAGLAHDFNNMLSAICTTADAAKLDLEEGRPVRPKDLAAIQAVGMKAGQLTSHLLRMGRFQASESESFDLSQRVEGLRGLLAHLATRGVQLQVTSDGALLRLHGNPVQVEQILVNLVCNARDAMPQGGLIHIRAEAGEPTPEGRRTALLRVEDHGTGMPAEVQVRIFEPFFTTKDPGKGTGLGLASVKGIVEAWGGSIQMESTVGVGTTFRITLPLSE
jgi:signal transduction histidine kinase